MTRSPKTVSIRHLRTAVNAALEAAKTAHPDVAFEPGDTTSSTGVLLPIYYRYPYFCGLPPSPWPEIDLGNIAEFNNVFVATLAQDKTISPVAAGGSFEPVVYASGGTVSIGFAPADVSFTE
jgi:hypothetical protein